MEKIGWISISKNTYVLQKDILIGENNIPNLLSRKMPKKQYSKQLQSRLILNCSLILQEYILMLKNLGSMISVIQLTQWFCKNQLLAIPDFSKQWLYLHISSRKINFKMVYIFKRSEKRFEKRNVEKYQYKERKRLEDFWCASSVLSVC